MVTYSLWATWANHSKSLIFGERPEQFAHIAESESFAFLKNFLKKWFHSNFFEQIASFFVSQKEKRAIRSKNERFAHSLFCAEQPEQITHISSFVMSDQSDSLTFAHLSRAIWAIERWANERIPNPAGEITLYFG